MKSPKWIYSTLAILFLFSTWPIQAFGQTSSAPSEVKELRSEIDRIKTQHEAQIKALHERLKRMEEAQTLRVTPAVASTPTFKAQDGEKEITLPSRPEIQTERGSLLEAAGLPRPEIFGTRISGFLVGSLSYNSALQMEPERIGGAVANADPGRSSFRFDKFGIGLYKTFAPWLSASAAMKVESHRRLHTHFTAGGTRGCPAGRTCERFGTEAAETVVTLDKFAVTAIAPLGNGLSLLLGRFDVPFGMERHDEPFLLTATPSEVFRFGRPQKMTGFLSSYQFNPYWDISGWAVNRWETETNEAEEDFNDNNRGKSFGGRIGFTPFPLKGLLNFGLGGFFGPEQNRRDSRRGVVDFDVTWTPARDLLFGGEFIYGGERRTLFRRIGVSADEIGSGNWWGFYLLGHYDLNRWLGLSLRYGLFNDGDGTRTGARQALQSFTLAPVIHLSALIPELRPMGATIPRTRHPLNWLDLKLEYRANHSNKPVFGNIQPGNAIVDPDKTSHQLQLKLIANY